MERCAVMSDHEIDGRVIEACRRGDREAFHLLFETYKDKVYSIALYFFHGDEATAEDITQEVFFRLFTKMKQFEDRSAFSTWLYRLVFNACVDEQRKRKRFLPYSEAAETCLRPFSTGEDDYRRIEVAASVQSALSQLTSDLRMTVLLRYFENLSYEEMAQALGCSKGTIASRLNRSHKILARKLSHLRGGPSHGDE